MKTVRKALLVALCAILLVVASVMGTLAYLTDQTGTINNTFTVGNVSFAETALDESVTDEYGAVTTGRTAEGNEYKLIPGHTYVKDPKIYMSGTTEDAWLFVKVSNGIADIEIAAADGDTIHEQILANGWEVVDEAKGIYGHTAKVSKNNTIDVFGSFTLATDAAVSNYGDAFITIQAYAVQYDGLDDVQAAWTSAPLAAWNN